MLSKPPWVKKEDHVLRSIWASCMRALVFLDLTRNFPTFTPPSFIFVGIYSKMRTAAATAGVWTVTQPGFLFERNQKLGSCGTSENITKKNWKAKDVVNCFMNPKFNKKSACVFIAVCLCVMIKGGMVLGSPWLHLGIGKLDLLVCGARLIGSERMVRLGKICDNFLPIWFR